MVNILLIAANDIETWIDKNAGILTFWGLIVGILSIIVAIIIYCLQKKASEKHVGEKSDEQKTIVEKQIQVLALEEQKMCEEVKPQLYVSSNIQDRNAHWIKLTISNNNRNGIARIIKLKRISEGWQLKTLPVNEITFTDSQIIVLEFSVDKNPDIFEIVLEIEDLYHNKYQARISSALSTIFLSKYE